MHLIQKVTFDPLEEFRRVNVKATLKLARKAAPEGDGILYLSVPPRSIATQRSQGDCSRQTIILHHCTPIVFPTWRLSRVCGRLPGKQVYWLKFLGLLVYGPGVKANFAAMMRWFQRSVHLLLGGIHIQRILVVLDHLVDLIVKCITHTAAASQIFLVSDGEDVSITELMRLMCKALVALARFIPGAGELAESVGGNGGQAGCDASAV